MSLGVKTGQAIENLLQDIKYIVFLKAHFSVFQQITSRPAIAILCHNLKEKGKLSFNSK